MSDIVSKLRQSYHLDTVQPEHPIRRAVDEIEKLRAECAELDEIRRAIGGDAYWMDPPDGGNVTLAEMVARANAAGRLADEALVLLVQARNHAWRSAPPGLMDKIDALVAKAGKQ